MKHIILTTSLILGATAVSAEIKAGEILGTGKVIDQFDRLTFVGVSTAPSGASSQKLVKEHCDIIDAIQARDKTSAARLINAHVMKSQKRLFTVLENPPIVD